jgi:hypothetical protein
VVVLSNTPQTISDFSFEHWRYGHGDCGIGFHHLFEELKLALLMALGRHKSTEIPPAFPSNFQRVKGPLSSLPIP